MSILQYILLFLSISAIWFYGFAIFAAHRHFSARDPFDPEFHPPVSILKPIRGLDSSAYENLASFCKQNYPEFQIVFGVQDENDPGLEVARRIQNEFSSIDVRIVASNRTIGANLKVSNLANMETEATFPILLLADSDIRVGRDYLKQVVQPLKDPSVGVVTCMYRSIASGTVGALEALGTSTEFHAGVLVARKLEGLKFALGSTIVIRKAALDEIGGFPSVADYLADDFLLGNLPARAGYSVVLSHYIVDHVLGTESWGDLVKHQTRWSRSTRASRPWGYLGLIFTHGIAFSLLLLLASRGSLLGWSVLGITWSVRWVMAWIIACHYLKDPLSKRFLWLVPIRDLISFAIWCYSFLGDTVEWRGQRFKLTRGGKLVPLAPLEPLKPLTEE